MVDPRERAGGSFFYVLRGSVLPSLIYFLKLIGKRS